MRTLNVRLPAAGGGYDVRVGSGLTGDLVSSLRRLRRRGAVVIVADETVARLHAKPLADELRSAGLDPRVLTFPSGEASKTRATKESIEDRMLAENCGRDTVVLAVGGGVTIDVAGFVAATYMRGVPFISLPTTMLAMVDSAIGGKTGVNVAAGKNLIGAFHQPMAVFCDTGRLSTLPDAELRCGLAEAVKHGLIGSDSHFTDIEASAGALLVRDEAVLERVVADSVAIKIAFVQKDEKETGARKALNFGHTFGHALERMSGWSIPHGEAVARGLIFEARLSAVLGLLDGAVVERIAAVLEALGLPGSPFANLDLSLRPGAPEGLDTDEFLAATRMDKKARQGRTEWVLLSAVGRVVNGWSKPVAEDEVRAVIDLFAGA